MTDVLMFSGGLDSYLAYLALKDNGINPTLVYANIGHRYRVEEESAAQLLATLHNESLITAYPLRLGGFEEANAFIPMRNGFLALAGALYGDTIWFAIMDGEQSYDDCKASTFTAMSIALSALKGTSTLVRSPFWDKTKTEVIASLDPAHYQRLKLTRSCHHMNEHEGKHCGRCGACFRRAVAFVVNGIEDTFVYNPFKGDLAEQYLQKVETDEHYGPKRSEEIRRAFRMVRGS